MVPWLARAGAASTLYRRVGSMMSEFSYTLYLVHFPLLAFIYFTFVAPAQLPFGVGSIAVLTGILVIVLAYAWAIWWLFERNTDPVRGFIRRQIVAFRVGAEPVRDMSR